MPWSVVMTMGSPGLHRIEVVEGVAVGGAVAGDGRVAELARERGADVVARPLPQVGRVRALDHHLVHADHGDPDVTDRITLGRILCVRRRHRRPRRQAVERVGVVDDVAQLLVGRLLRQGGAQRRLGVRLLEGGAPDLVHGEEEEDDSRPHQDAARDVEGAAERGHGGKAYGGEAGIPSHPPGPAGCPRVDQPSTVTRVPSGV